MKSLRRSYLSSRQTLSLIGPINASRVTFAGWPVEQPLDEEDLAGDGDSDNVRTDPFQLHPSCLNRWGLAGGAECVFVANTPTATPGERSQIYFRHGFLAEARATDVVVSSNRGAAP
jgi:hypothetical protein